MDRRKEVDVIRAVAAYLAVLVMSVLPAGAGTLSDPTGPVVLTVTGKIGNGNTSGVAAFDLEMLEAMGTAEITTSTIWTSGLVTFTGVRLAKLLEHVDAQGSTLEATAINNYSIAIPVSDATDDGPIIAYLRDGKHMSIRDKGPLWIIYPYDQSAAYQTELIYSRSIWQLDRIVVAD